MAESTQPGSLPPPPPSPPQNPRSKTSPTVLKIRSTSPHFFF
ncbi:hypothetical protein PDIG_63960 [Penicillium digitatum PHI26]|uniref:Uncharacterized protein n=2 Tax=Penicillium digitatum TaxID=36651 RepID=K9G710_PEND2|nr:hypothetical protein PDIP_73310 [Penicillium digitatum Pd1]EKV07558.1 hypothetical protein PDIP_73310 [Penicillium digitatum Pd1]EKV08996.1 hypothetical protein PDIG_63960 [Penicillium digitatum PHI26]